MTNDKQPRFKIPDECFGVPKEGSIERALAEAEQHSQQPQTTMPITSSGDYWEIPNVEYRNGIYRVRLLKTLLDNGNAKTQGDWIEYSKQARQKGEFYLGNMAFQYSTFKALSQQNTPEAIEARDFIRSQMRGKWLMTTTRLRYNPNGVDEVIHGYTMPDELKMNVGLVAPDRFVTQEDSKVLEALLLESDFIKVNQVFNFINGTNAYVWRLNSKPETTSERVAGFLAGSVRALLYCYRDPSLQYQGLGVFSVAPN